MTVQSAGGAYKNALGNLLSVMDAPPEPPPPPPAEPKPREGDGDGDGWPDPSPAPALRHATLDAFFREVIRPLYRRKVSKRGSRRWSAEWWRHDEAVARLEALWRSWEQLRQDPAMGMITWFREADYHMDMLFSPEGPFAESEDETRPGQMLPHVDPPEGLFTPAQAYSGGKR